MPVTFLTFAMGYLAIIGFPGFSGFWSKDKIIEAAFGREPGSSASFALLGAGITAFYMTRLMLMTFFTEKRWEEGVHPHESPKVMTVPLIVLAALSVLGGVLLRRRLDRRLAGARHRSRRAPRAAAPGHRHHAPDHRSWWPPASAVGLVPVRPARRPA